MVNNKTKFENEYLEEITIEQEFDMLKENLELCGYNRQMFTTSIMRFVGFVGSTKGYVYLRDAILYSIDSPEECIFVTKDIYPWISTKYKTSPDNVERAIRCAINTAWNGKNAMNKKSAQEKFYRLFQTAQRPTNSEMIALISERVRYTISNM